MESFEEAGLVPNRGQVSIPLRGSGYGKQKFGNMDSLNEQSFHPLAGKWLWKDFLW